MRSNQFVVETSPNIAEIVKSRSVTFWLGDDFSSPSVASPEKFLMSISRLAHFALAEYIEALPSIEHMTEALIRCGIDAALSLADRTLGRKIPVLLEDPFHGRHPRRDLWQKFLNDAFRGAPAYQHRAVAALVERGMVRRVVTVSRDELLESALVGSDGSLQLCNALRGEVPSGEIDATILLKMRGSLREFDEWPLDLRHISMVEKQPVSAYLGNLLEQHPTLVLGYHGPDSLDLGRLFSRTMPKQLIWVDNQQTPLALRKFSPPEHQREPSLQGDFAARLLSHYGGYRVRGSMALFLENLCHELGVEVSGPAPDEEVTAVRYLEDSLPSRNPMVLPGFLQAMGDELRQHWVGAFVLITWLDLWNDSGLQEIHAKRISLEQHLAESEERFWFRYVVGQTARSSVETALARHFRGEQVPPLSARVQMRLQQALDALTGLSQPSTDASPSNEDLAVERSELSFAISGTLGHLPSAAQAIAELPSATHAERWLRLKAAGALMRQRWSVAAYEMEKALVEGSESSAPLMMLRARVALASMLTALCEMENAAALVGCLTALRRYDWGLQEQVIHSANCFALGMRLALGLLEQALPHYWRPLVAYQPPVGPIVDDYVRLALRIFGSQAPAFLFDRDVRQGRHYAFIPEVEDLVSSCYLQAVQQKSRAGESINLQSITRHLTVL